MNDAEIIIGLKRGDAAAGDSLVKCYGDRLLRSAYLLCGDGTVAQDLVQDTLIEAIKSARRFRGRSALYTWLHGILVNRSREYHRKRQRLTYTEHFPTQKISCPPESVGLDKQAAAAVLAQAIEQLSPMHREVLILRYYERMRLKEIARRLETTVGTVKSRLHYAANQLRILIPEEMNLFGVEDAQGTEKAQAP